MPATTPVHLLILDTMQSPAVYRPLEVADLAGGGGASGGATETTAAAMLTQLQQINDGTPPAALVQGLTDAQLRADPVVVVSSRWAEMEAAKTDTSTAGTTYVLMEPGTSGRGIAWAVRRIVSTSTGDTITVAGPGNNSGVATGAAAWTARTTLTYGAHQGA